MEGNTRWDYRVEITRHVVPRIGRVSLQSLTRRQVRALYQSLLATGNTRVLGKGLSRKSVLNAHRCLRAALNDAVEDGLLRANPATGAFSYSAVRERKEMLTRTVEGVQAFLAYVADCESMVCVTSRLLRECGGTSCSVFAAVTWTSTGTAAGAPAMGERR